MTYNIVVQEWYGYWKIMSVPISVYNGDTPLQEWCDETVVFFLNTYVDVLYDLIGKRLVVVDDNDEVVEVVYDFGS